MSGGVQNYYQIAVRHTKNIKDTSYETEKTNQTNYLYSELIEDLKPAMLTVEKLHGGIKNDSSFAMKILWDIFEEAEYILERQCDFSVIEDWEIESMFAQMFPKFIEKYPNHMTLSD